MLMKNAKKIGLLAAVALASFTSALAADITGKWTSEFESQVGHLKYVFQLKADGDKITGKAHRESSEAKSDQDVQNGKIDGDNISFSETLHVQEQDITIEYSGKIEGDELKLTRKVGDFGSMNIVAKRAKPDVAAVSGKWRAEFDTQIGKQKYLFTLQADGNTVSGKANAEIGDQKIETPLSEGKINGSEVTFVENMEFNGAPIRIDYKGSLDGDQIKFHRKVGDIATEDFTANRQK
jgi:hypothetical protein